MPRGGDDELESGGLGGLMPQAPTVQPVKDTHAKTAAVQRRRLDGTLMKLADTQGFSNWIGTRNNFRSYSIDNQLLIAMQMPTATRVQTAKHWAKAGRQVIDGARQIKITGRSSYPKVEVDPETGKSTVRQIPFWPSVGVYDISQTQGDPISISSRQQSVDPARYVSRLEQYAHQQGIEIVRDEVATTSAYDAAARRITLGAAQDQSQQVSSLVREIARASHEPGDVDEAALQAVAQLVCDTVGLDAHEHVRAPEMWSNARSADSIKQAARRIDKMAAKIEAVLEVKAAA